MSRQAYHVFVAISGMKDYEIMSEFSLHCSFFQPKRQTRMEMIPKRHEPRCSG